VGNAQPFDPERASGAGLADAGRFGEGDLSRRGVPGLERLFPVTVGVLTTGYGRSKGLRSNGMGLDPGA